MEEFKFELTNIFDSSLNSIEYKNEVEITVHYHNHSSELFISHFYVFERNRNQGLGTRYYKFIKNYAYKNENIDKFRFHIKKNTSSMIWLNKLGEEYTTTKVTGVGEVCQIEYRV